MGMRNAKVDANQPEIVSGLRELGYEVILLHRVGDGVPDLLVSTKSDMWLVEVKIPRAKLNERQERFHSAWNGKPIIVAHSLSEILSKLPAQPVPSLQ